MTDLEFRKLFVALSALGIIIFIVLIANITLGIGLLSYNLWIVAGLLYITIISYYLLPLSGKIATLFISTFAFSTFLFFVFNFSISSSLIISFLPTVIVFGLFALL